MRCGGCGVDKLRTEFSAVHTLGPSADDPEGPDLATLCLRCLQKALPEEALVEHGIHEEVRWLDGVRLRAAAATRGGGGDATVSVVMMDGERFLVPVGPGTTVKDLKVFLGERHKRNPRQYRLLLGLDEMKVRSEDGTTALLARYTGPRMHGSTIRALVAFTEFAGQHQIAGARVDAHGNAAGDMYDLGVRGAFEGMAIAILNVTTNLGGRRECELGKARTALEEKGFRVLEWTAVPTQAEFDTALATANQFWLLSGRLQDGALPAGIVNSIVAFYQRGRGVYLWGDNDPLNDHVNIVSKALFGPRIVLHGNDPGQQSLQQARAPGDRGFDPCSHIFTGIVNVYEGYTIARIGGPGIPTLRTVMVSSAGYPVTAVVEDGVRCAIVDGAWTRLYISWDQAGTSRFVKNASTWLCGIDADWVD